MTTATFDYETIAERAKAALDREFPNLSVATEPGLGGRVHLKIVSTAFNGLDHEAKQALAWRVLRDELGPDALAVGLMLVYGMDELP